MLLITYGTDTRPTRSTRPVFLPVFIVGKMQYVCQLMPPAIKLTFLHAVNVTGVTPDFPPYLRFWVHIYMPVSRLVRTDGAKLYATCTGRPTDIKLIDYGVPSGVNDLTVPPDRIDMGSCTNRNDLKNTWLDYSTQSPKSCYSTCHIECLRPMMEH